jgi:hypothetical protein
VLSFSGGSGSDPIAVAYYSSLAFSAYQYAQLVIGNKLYYALLDHPSFKEFFDRYNSIDSIDWKTLPSLEDHKENRHWSEEKWNLLAGNDWGTFNEYKNKIDYFESLNKNIKNEVIDFHKELTGSTIHAASYTVVGRDIYIDCNDQKFYKHQEKILYENLPNIRINKLRHGGHSDGCFHTLKPGVILSLYDIQRYETTFPNWDVCYLPNQSWDKVDGFLKLKHQVGGKWWVPGEEENTEFTHFVETWLQDWVGYAEETVFDVNVLVLDEHHVCINNMNPTVIEFLKKHNMEPVHVPWRHRYFWDGGLHCITLDLEREGEQEDYFPERGSAGIIDHGFD